MQEELGTPARSCARSTSLPPPSSRVSAGTEAEVAGGTEASCSPGGTCCPWAGCPCAHRCCASWAKKAAFLQQCWRQRRQPARRVRPLTRATGQWSCRYNPGQVPPDLGRPGRSFWDPRRQLRRIVIKPDPWTEAQAYTFNARNQASMFIRLTSPRKRT